MKYKTRVCLLTGMYVLSSFLYFKTAKAESQGESQDSTQVGRPANSLLDAIREGKPLMDLRVRYEHDRQEGKPQQAHAFTLRSLLGWQTGTFNSLRLTAQVIDVAQLRNDYDDNSGGISRRPDYPMVVDPDYFAMHQLFIDWAGLPSTTVRAGRQELVLDDGRHIGNSGLRQVSRVYDGVGLRNTSLANTELYLAHFYRYNQPTTEINHADIEIAHANYKFSPTEMLAGYGYFLDLPTSNGLADKTNVTFGLRLNGSRAIAGPTWKLLYTAEFAKQDSYKDAPDFVNAHYSHLGLGASRSGWTIRYDREAFSSNGQYAFQTTLGNSHQGSADLFGGIPQDGLIDDALSISGRLWSVDVIAGYHHIDSDVTFATANGANSHRYGNEWDLGGRYTINQQFIVGLDYANFTEGDKRLAGSYPTVEKMWLTLLYRY